MKLSLIVVPCLFLLTSCGSSTTPDTGLKTFEGSGFTIRVPSAWTPVSSQSLPRLAAGSIALALTSPEIATGFANNLTILKDTLQTKLSSSEYAMTNYIHTTGTFLELVKLDQKSVAFSDGDKSVLYVFEARYNTKTPKQKFLQTAKVC
jgi:hypothetical protein